MSSWDNAEDDEQTAGSSDVDSFCGQERKPAAEHWRRDDLEQQTAVSADASSGVSLKREAATVEIPTRTRQRLSRSDDVGLRLQQETASFGSRVPTAPAMQTSGIARREDPLNSFLRFGAPSPSQQHRNYTHQLSGDAIATLAARGYPTTMLGPSGSGQSTEPFGGLMGLTEVCRLREQITRNQEAAMLLGLSQLGSLPRDCPLSLYGSHDLGGSQNLLRKAMMQSQLQLATQQQQTSPFQQQQLLLQQLAFEQSIGLGPTNRFPPQNSALSIGSAELTSFPRLGHNDGFQGQQNQRQFSITDVPSGDSQTSATIAPNQQQRDSPATPPNCALSPDSIILPPTCEGKLLHWSLRDFFPLGVDEDANWLSEFHCFVRSDLIEIFRASAEDAQMRNGSIVHLQVGMRCRYCAHQKVANRAGRSSAFPSSIRQIYQSFTMMLRDHFGSCNSIPSSLLVRFVKLKDKPAQGATDSKRYWMHAAAKVGMTDSSDGIQVSEESRARGHAAPPFGFNPNKQWGDETYSSVALVLPSDRHLVTDFLYLVMRQVQPIRLLDSECTGNRRSLQVGLPGLGCRFCCQQHRMGLCRVFPARRRTLPGKIAHIYDHLRRCILTPADVKQQLEMHHDSNQKAGEDFYDDEGSNKELFDLVWSRLGHDRQSA